MLSAIIPLRTSHSKCSTSLHGAFSVSSPVKYLNWFLFSFKFPNSFDGDFFKGRPLRFHATFLEVCVHPVPPSLPKMLVQVLLTEAQTNIPWLQQPKGGQQFSKSSTTDIKLTSSQKQQKKIVVFFFLFSLIQSDYILNQ
jgi:hypothetical protein